METIDLMCALKKSIEYANFEKYIDGEGVKLDPHQINLAHQYFLRDNDIAKVDNSFLRLLIREFKLKEL